MKSKVIIKVKLGQFKMLEIRQIKQFAKEISFQKTQITHHKFLLKRIFCLQTQIKSTKVIQINPIFQMRKKP